MTETKYIHTFSQEEQDRLIAQSELVAPFVHENIDFSGASRILEIGCGVGAQIRIICRKYPNATVHGVDISEMQIARAENLLSEEIAAKKVSLNTSPASKLPHQDSFFDAVFICFVLEHLSNPIEAVMEAKRVLKPGGLLVCTEVFNDALFVYPSSPAIMEYWGAFNKMQSEIGGDPNIGIRLCNIMIQSGLEVRGMSDASYMLDQRIADTLERKKYLDHWYSNFMSAKEQLLDSAHIDESVLEEFEQEYSVLRSTEDTVFLYSNRQVSAVKLS